MEKTMQGKLNLFQRSVLYSCGAYHPYNAVHGGRINAVFEPKLLHNIINTFIENLGLTGYHLDKKEKKYHYSGGPADIKVEILEKSESCTSFMRKVETEINCPFPYKEKFTPFRFFVSQDKNSFYLGLSYFHPVADGHSIIFLFRTISESYLKKTIPDPDSISLYPPTYRSLLPLFNFKYIFGGLASLPESSRRVRKSFAPRYRDRENYENGFEFFKLDQSILDMMLNKSREWNITLNDLFLAIIMLSISPMKHLYAYEDSQFPIMNTVNIRKDLKIDNSSTFGLFLGFLYTSCSIHGNQNIKHIAVEMHKQTKKAKKYRLYLKSIFEMAPLIYFGKSEFRKEKEIYAQDIYPLWAGISNINLDPLWPQASAPESVDYFRAVSTGPFSPVVFSITTVCGVLNIGLSYRKTVFTPEDINTIITSFTAISSDIYKY